MNSDSIKNHWRALAGNRRSYVEATQVVSYKSGRVWCSVDSMQDPKTQQKNWLVAEDVKGETINACSLRRLVVILL